MNRHFSSIRVCSLVLGAGVSISLGTAERTSAAVPPQAPALVVETGMHTDFIRSISTDALGRFVVTGSRDKTVRVWNASTNELIRTLRPPIASGIEGEIDAVAMSPDGDYVVAGGATGAAWDKTYCVYIFSRQTGQIFDRIAKLPGRILKTSFSRDGSYIAVTMLAGGFRVFQFPSLTPVGSAVSDPNPIYGADFGRGASGPVLAVACYDGHIRSYSIDTAANTLKAGPSVAFPLTDRPYSVAYSPDSSKIAVGYLNALRVDVLDASTLTADEPPHYESDPSLHFVNTIAVAWTRDGKMLYGGCSARTGPVGHVRIGVWATDGTWKSNVPLGTDGITAMTPVGTDRIAYADNGPSWGVFDESGRTLGARRTVVRGFANVGSALRVSPDGSKAEFSYGGTSDPLLCYDLKTLALTREPPGRHSLLPSALTPSDVSLTNIGDTPLMQNVPLSGLAAGEYSHCAAILADHSVLIGTDRAVRWFDKNGHAIRSVVLDSWCYGIAAAEARKVVVIALADGTIRWLRLPDLSTLCTLHLFHDGQEWVLATPKGYYAPSVGGEALVGWSINGFADTSAEYHPIGEFRAQYLRPGLLQHLIDTLDEQAAEVADSRATGAPAATSVLKTLPPVVRVISPADDSSCKTSATVRFSVSSQNEGAIQSIRVLVNGIPTKATVTGLGKLCDTGVGTAKVTLTPGSSTIAVQASNRYGYGQAAGVRVSVAGSASPALPRLLLLAIGTDPFDKAHKETGSPTVPASDVQRFANLMQKQHPATFSQCVVTTLCDEKATEANVLSAFETLSQNARPADLAVIYLTGHGFGDNPHDYYFFPWDGQKTHLFSSCTPFSRIDDVIIDIPCAVVVFLDTCHSGTARSPQELTNDRYGLTATLDDLERRGLVLFTSCGPQQESVIDDDLHETVFAKAVLDGLNGSARSGPGQITAWALSDYLGRRFNQTGSQVPLAINTYGRPVVLATTP